MTKHLVRILLIAASVPLYAQSDFITATVPFDFVAGAKSFPAGAYTLKVDAGLGTILLRSADGGSGLITLAHSVSSGKAEAAHLTFHFYGDRYFLSQVWQSGAVSGYELTLSATEREQLARNRPIKPVNVAASIARR